MVSVKAKLVPNSENLLGQRSHQLDYCLAGCLPVSIRVNDMT